MCQLKFSATNPMSKESPIWGVVKGDFIQGKQLKCYSSSWGNAAESVLHQDKVEAGLFGEKFLPFVPDWSIL